MNECGKEACGYDERITSMWARMNHLVETELHRRTGRAVEELQGMLNRYVEWSADTEFADCPKFHRLVLFNLGCAYEHAGDLETSIEMHRRLIGDDPNDHEALYTAGTNLCKLRRFGEALPFLEKAVELEPGNANYRQNLGYARREGRETVTRTRTAHPMKHPRLGWGPIC